MMKIRKRIIAFLLSVLMLISLLPVQAWAEGYTLRLWDNYNGGSTLPTEITGITTYELPRLERNNYTHTKWCTETDPGTGGTVYNIGDTVTLTNDMELYAIWEKNYWTVTLKPNGGTGNNVNDNVTKGEEYILPTAEQCGFAYEGGYFIGWATSEDGAAAYKPGDKITINRNTTFYAVWGYKVSLNPNGGTGGEKTYIVCKESNYVLPTIEECGFVYDEFCALRWATDPNGKDSYRPGDKVEITDNMTFYAVWIRGSAVINDITPLKKNREKYYIGDVCWRTIGLNDNKVLLISYGVLGGNMMWSKAKEYCTTVFNNFTYVEKSSVISTTKEDDPAYDIYNSEGLNNADLFLLSASEAEAYFLNNDDRIPDTDGWGILGSWWLRSSSRNGRYHFGAVGKNGTLVDNSKYDNNGARPAFVLDLQSVLFTSAATGGKYSDPVDGSSFGTFRDGDPEEKKLTLIDTLEDSARKNFTASCSGASGKTIDIEYSGAVTGEKEYVSAIICDASGSILKYASKTPGTNGSGTWTMTLPDLADGDYTLKVFSEQQNGDKKTDYASPATGFPLKISNGEITKIKEKPEPGPAERKPDKVPFTTEGEFYASTEDNFAAESGSGKITGLVLDFSRISESSIAPSDLKMTAISGSRFTTKAELKDKKSFKADKGIKVKVNKSTLIPAITVKKSGSVTLEMSDGNSFTIAFRVEKPKAVKKEKQQRQGSGKITKTISDLFGTSIDSGELTATGNAEVYGNSAIIDTAEKGSIKIQYKYLNKIYKMTVKVK